MVSCSPSPFWLARRGTRTKCRKSLGRHEGEPPGYRGRLGLQHKGAEHWVFLPSTADPSSTPASLRHQLWLQLHLTPSLPRLPCPSIFLFQDFFQNYRSSVSWVSTHRAVWTCRGVTPWCDHQPLSINTQAPVLWRDNLKFILGPRSTKAQLPTCQ